jgi:hypothetical protein
MVVTCATEPLGTQFVPETTMPWFIGSLVCWAPFGYKDVAPTALPEGLGGILLLLAATP